MEPIWPPHLAHVEAISHLLPAATRRMQHGLVMRWYIENQTETTTTTVSNTASGHLPPVWYQLIYNPANGRVANLFIFTKHEVLCNRCFYFFGGFEDLGHSLIRAPPGLMIRCNPPVGLVMADDGEEYTWQQILDYLWTYMTLDLLELGLMILPSEANRFEITLDPLDLSYCLSYIH